MKNKLLFTAILFVVSQLDIEKMFFDKATLPSRNQFAV
jgi:hypothetical protein